MDIARVIRIRPVSWRISVQGEQQAQHVRQVLQRMNVETSELEPEPTLTDPPVLAFLATPAAHLPFTRQELEAILERDAAIELEFEDT